MDVLRTPDSRFENLTGYPFAPHYLDVTASDTQPLRMHYIDEGLADGARLQPVQRTDRLPAVIDHGSQRPQKRLLRLPIRQR